METFLREEEIGYWNEELRGTHEYDIALKIAKHGYIIQTVPEPLIYRKTISNHRYIFKIEEMFDLWHYYGNDFIHCIGFKRNHCYFTITLHDVVAKKKSFFFFF